MFGKNAFTVGTLIAAALVGIAAGVGAFTFFYAKGASYMGNDPNTCANCHVMQAHFNAWEKGSHHTVATCNDCHAPHDSVIAKYFVKAKNGWNHSVAFTTGKFHEPIRITQPNVKVTEGACRYCHQPIVDAIDPPHAGSTDTSCIRCHKNVGHPLYQ